METLSRIKPFRPEKLILGILLSDRSILPALLERLRPRFGDTDFISSPLDFTYTDYYEAEMGPGLTRYFVSFEKLVDPSGLWEVKGATNLLEEESRTDGNRSINLDPGLLNLSRLVLASTKNNVHRIPLKKGIYAEVTLVYVRGCFQELFWTYPDFRSEEYKSILTQIRELYRRQLKQ
jgi:hypothetical protein